MNTEFEKALDEYVHMARGAQRDRDHGVWQSHQINNDKREAEARARVVALYEAERGHHAVTADRLMNAETSLARLQAECDRLRTDAERWRWLRVHRWAFGDAGPTAADLDRAIDAAIASTAPAQEEGL